MTMTKDEFMECLDKLLGSQDQFTISMQIKMKRSPPRRKEDLPKATRELADRFKEMLAADEYPFDNPVVDARDIHDFPEFKNHPFSGVCKALKAIGGKPAGLINDGSARYARARVWIVADHEVLDDAPLERLESVYQRREA